MKSKNSVAILSLGFLIASSLAEAADSDGLVCHLVSNKNDPKIVRLISYDIEIIRLRFTGLEPDRFFSATGKGSYTQFATKKNSVSPLVNKIDASSTLVREFLYGGEKFTWRNGQESKRYLCNPEKTEAGR